METKKCPKCGYVRQPTDDAPDWQCPSCGVAYVKVAGGQAKQREALRDSKSLAKRRSKTASESGLMKFLKAHRQAVTLGLVSVACLTVGFFAGRIYTQHQITLAFAEAAGAFAKGMSEIPATLAGRSPTPVESKSSEPSPAPSSSLAPEPIQRPQPIAATLLHKGFIPADSSSGQYDSLITFKVRFENETQKNIRAFDGTLVFTDLLDNLIMKVKVAVNDPLDTFSPLTWEGTLDYNQFMDRHQRLRVAEIQNTKMSFVPNKVLYADGSVEMF